MKKRLTRTEKWTQGKPEIPAYISTFLALKANQGYNLRIIKRQSDFFDTIITDIDRWHSYYDDFMLIVGDAWESFQTLSKIIDSEEQLKPAMDACQTIINPPEELIRQFQESGEETIKNFLPAVSDFLRSFMLNDFILDDDNNESLAHHGDLFENQGMSFLSTVVLPCLLEFQTMPLSLYQKAVNGNYDALEMLVQLDKNIITHPQIKPVWSTLASMPTNYQFERISKALSKKPTARMNIKRVKVTNAALIELLFDVCNNNGWINYKLSREDISNLFDDVSRDLTGQYCDDDFAGTPDGRSRAINREIKRLREQFQKLDYFPKPQ